MTPILLPYRFKKIGWLLFFPSFILGIFSTHFSELLPNVSITTIGWFGNGLLGKEGPPFGLGQIELLPNLSGILFLTAGLLIVFSKEKIEDEYINQLRLRSFQSAVLINYLLLFVCILFIHRMAFLSVMLYNLFTTIIIYIVKFQYLIHKSSISSHE